MKEKKISVIAFFLLLVWADTPASTEPRPPALQIHLPRQITIEGDVPNLGQVAVVRGDESLAARAAKVTLGRISAPGQKIIIDRPTVLGRLASSGIVASEVTFTGAEKISVTRQHQIIRGGEFTERALAFLKENNPDDSVCRWDPTRTPDDLILSGISEDMKWHIHPVSSGSKNRAKIRVAVLSAGTEVAVREITFLLKYNCRQLVAKVDIAPGTVISPENIRIEKTVSNYPEPADWAAPYGLSAKRLVPANTVINSKMTGPLEPPILFKRNKSVLIKVDRLGLVVTAVGRAMQDGRAGEYVKVQNTDSQRIIMARVNEDGSVEPVF